MALQTTQPTTLFNRPQPSNTSSIAYYQWRFTELEAPFAIHELISENPTNPNFRLNWFEAIQYGRSYEVSVRIATYPGPVSGDYGSVCTIELQSNVLSDATSVPIWETLFLISVM